MSWRPEQRSDSDAPVWPEPTLRKDNDEAEPDLGPYKDAYDAAPPETQDAIRAALERKDPNTPLLYELLGSGTPPFKMPQDEADYTDESPKDEQACQNCEFFYVGADGEGICSQVRGEVVGPGWCRLWQALQTRKAKSRQYVESRDEAPEGVKVQTGEKGGLYYETAAVEGESRQDEGTTPGGSVDAYEKEIEQRAQSANIEEWPEGKSPLDVDTMEEYEEFERPFHVFEAPDAIDEETPKAIDSFGGWPNSENTLPLWEYAREKYGNENIHPDLKEEAGDYELGESKRAELEQAVQLDQELHRRHNPTYDPETDTIKVYRGTGAGHFQEQLRQLTFTGVGERTDEVNVNHRSVESWTANPVVAGNFAEDNNGVVVERRVPVEQVVGSFLSSGLFGGEEAEIIVAETPGGETYSRENINIMDNEETYELYHSEAVKARNAWAEEANSIDS